MGKTERSDMKINGDGSLSGGAFGAVTINGAGTVHGDVDCSTLRVNGAGDIDGAVKAETVIVNGSASFKREVHAGEMTVNGDSTVHGGAGIGILKVKGRLAIDGGLAAREVELRGDMRVGNDLEAEVFDGEGAFKIGGLLNAGVVDMRVHGASSAREIGGERITVRLPRGFSALSAIFTFSTDKRLTVETIEGDEIYLESTVAKVVRGGRVQIGEGCDIDLVEYTSEIITTPGVVVKASRKIDFVS
ncbi:MAG: polymer-forming cytoskeletal protein [Actinomycetota bacterium]|nr:polymer-forming cytoskeletal protein [Actinomycetota bacterium]